MQVNTDNMQHMHSTLCEQRAQTKIIWLYNRETEKNARDVDRGIGHCIARIFKGIIFTIFVDRQLGLKISTMKFHHLA